jgi:ABC-type transport system involved in cytochrome c biogenesis permease subunit
MITGLCLFHDGRGYRVRWLDKIQAYSGLYLSTYFVIHGAATIFLVRGITFYEASGGKGGLLQDPSVFLSYYSLAVLALFVHTACALRNILTFHWSQRTAEKLAYALIVIGFVTTTTIAMALSGVHLHNDRDRIAVQRR